MPSSTTELIKSKLDIVDFLRGYLTLQPAGRNFKALCPFHSEKTPSFSISPDRQSWHCFGCGLGGDIFTFVMRYENMEFGEAMRFLAEKAGVELRHENPAEYRYTGLLFDLNDQAKNFFRKALAAAPVAKEYLAGRGLSAQTIEEFEIGWAPNEPEGLSMHLLNNGAAPQDIIQAGLSIKTERGLMLDRFRGRIMFPIHNHQGKVVGFTGRILPQLDKGDMGKYINSPETPIFQKSKLLYGFWRSKDAIREAKSAVLMEGQMDFLMSWQSGIKNVIASSGTALTGEHLKSVRRLADELIVSFDSDTAGSDAAERAIDLAEASDFSVKVSVLQGFKDAADAAKEDPEHVRRAIASAMRAPEFYFRKYLPKTSEELHSREGIQNLRVVLAKLKTIASPVEQGYWFRELSARTGIDEKTLTAESERAAPSQFESFAPKQVKEETVKRQLARRERIIEDLLSVASAKNQFDFLSDSLEYFPPLYREVYEALKSGRRKSEDQAIDAVLDAIVLAPIGESLQENDIQALNAELAKEYYKERRKVLTQAIKNAEAKGNDAELAAALKELASLPKGAGDQG